MKQLFKFLICLTGMVLLISVYSPTKAEPAYKANFETSILCQAPAPAIDFCGSYLLTTNEVILVEAERPNLGSFLFETNNFSKPEPYTDLRIINTFNAAIFADYNFLKRPKVKLEFTDNRLLSKARLCDNGPWVNGMFLSRIS